MVRGSGRMAQELSAFPALPEDWSLVPRTHVLSDSEPSVTPVLEDHLPSSGFYKYLHTYNITQPAHTHTNTMLFLKSEAKDDLDLKVGPSIELHSIREHKSKRNVGWTDNIMIQFQPIVVLANKPSY